MLSQQKTMITTRDVDRIALLFVRLILTEAWALLINVNISLQEKLA